MAVLDSEKVAASPLRDVPSLPDEPSYIDEKKLGDSTEYVSRQTDSAYDKTGSLEELNYDGDVLRVNGEVVIRTGADVSNFLLDIRDDEDPALTFRSIVLGTVFAGLGAALCQVSSLASWWRPRANISVRYTCSNPSKSACQQSSCCC